MQLDELKEQHALAATAVQTLQTIYYHRGAAGQSLQTAGRALSEARIVLEELDDDLRIAIWEEHLRKRGYGHADQ